MRMSMSETTPGAEQAPATLVKSDQNLFLAADGRCRIYAARPKQCRDFPRAWRVDGCPGLAPA